MVDANIYEIVDECEYFYYKKSGDSKNYCTTTNDCQTEGLTYKFFVKGRKNCE